MPFGPYKDHADCVKKNQDKDDPHAYCATIERTIKKRQQSSRIQFGVDSDYQFYNRFQAGPPSDAGDIPLTGTFLDFEATSNGWYIDPAEEQNLVSDQGRVTFRVAHSKEPERVIGEYKRFWAAEDDGCVDAYGKPLGRHVDFEATTNPADPQLRINIMKGWVNDISPGLDAEVFCSKCNEPWGLDANNKLVKSCEHQDALGVLRNITKKEGSMVTEPAFEGRTQFRMPTFAMTMNRFFSPDENESEPLATRVIPHAGLQASDDGRQTKGGINMVSSKDGTDGDTKQFTAQDITRFMKDAGFVHVKAEGEGEGEGQDEMARYRAALKLVQSMDKKMAKMGWVKKGEGESEMDAEGEGKTEADAEGAFPYKKNPVPAEGEGDVTPPETGDTPKVAPGDQQQHVQAPYTQPGSKPNIQKGPTASMSAEDMKIVADAQAYKAKLEAQKLVTESKTILAQKEEDDKLANLTAARNILEKTGDKDGATRLDATITELAKKHLEASKKESSTKGAETPSAEINFSASNDIATGVMPRFNAEARARFDNAFRTEFFPKFKERSYGR